MNIIGLQAFYYNHATALLKDGNLEFFCEEEKLNRAKGQREGFPVLTLELALENSGLSLCDIDEIAYPMDPWRYSATILKSGISALLAPIRSRLQKCPSIDPISLTGDRMLSTLQYTPPFLDSLIRHRIRYGGLPGRIPPIAHVPHHEAHAASAFYTSGFDEAAIVILDGVGETESTSIWRGRGKAIERLDEIPFPNSLGEFYAAFTEYCGFRVYQQEGKLMGLAAYGGPNEDVSKRIEQVIRIGAERYDVSPKFTIGGNHTHGVAFSDGFVELFGPPRQRRGELTDWYRDIAYAAQDCLERAALEIVKKALRMSGCRNLCLSGGVAMNCKLNGTILHSGVVDQLSVLPASNDAGVALGAAMVRAIAKGDDPRMELRHAYYGPSFSDEEIEAALINAKVAYQKIKAGGLGEVVDLLCEGRVVGLFSGAAEFGARALGARSIIADPRDPKMCEMMNCAVKHREPWRPFAPVILAGHEAEWWVDGRESRFMMKGFHVRPEKIRQIPAVVHVDGTCRPQSISREINPTYYDILEEFHRRTGVPILMNTSFNLRGEPIVCRPIEALRCYFSTGIDALVIGPFLLRKA